MNCYTVVPLKFNPLLSSEALVNFHRWIIIDSHNSLCFGWFNDACFGITRVHPQEDETLKKLLCKLRNTVLLNVNSLDSSFTEILEKCMIHQKDKSNKLCYIQ